LEQEQERPRAGYSEAFRGEKCDAGFEGGGEILIDAEGPDSPETFSGDTIDVGALAEQFFGLAIDPYPRKAGASLEAAGPDEPVENEFQQKLRSLLGKS